VASRATLLDLLRYAVNFEIILVRVEGSGECREMSCLDRCRHRRYAPRSASDLFYIRVLSGYTASTLMAYLIHTIISNVSQS